MGKTVKKKKGKKKIKQAAIAVLMIMLLCSCAPAYADSIPSNWEVFDEVSTVGELGGSDALWGSKHFDLGLMVGVTDYKNPFNNNPAGSYIMVKGDIKGIRLVNRLWDFVTKKK